MYCIKCEGNENKLAKSHIVPNFIRKRLTGDIDSAGAKKFKFKWIGRKDLPHQDLPKPNLMCEACDSELGEKVEKKIAPLIMPSNVNCSEEWGKLPIYKERLDEVKVFDSSFVVGKYSYPEEEKDALDKFAVSVAWRALHAMEKDGREHSKTFLNSQRGKLIHKSVIGYLFNNEPSYNFKVASFYYLGPESALYLSNKSDEMPFAWAELGENDELLGVGVFFAYWVIIWPLFECDMLDYFDKLIRLEQIVFNDFAHQIKSDLNRDKFA